MAKVSTNISIDAETKAQAQAMLADLGMDLSTAVNIFLKQMVYEGGIPFYITRRTPNLVTLAAIEAAEKGEGIHGSFDSVDAMVNTLNE
ncbi:MAG: type II toxin-antitoxin system RelB/DinJ family antitoxin [Clostridia bacterium]|nr:type II toxin-antitoxin system RelB/DinJ family antitoxin [Clostridia bacterium]MBO7296092.1 type II toxin-antitoxin system RelB/DinJ family antitoxin [Clostridia bacterium]